MTDKEKYTIDNEYVAMPEIILPGHKPKEEVENAKVGDESEKEVLRSENLAMPEITIPDDGEQKHE